MRGSATGKTARSPSSRLGVEFPVSWSLNATNIVAQKYFRGTLGTPERESSLRQVIDRVADTITQWGADGGYFVDEPRSRRSTHELKYILVTQRAAFNSPVWFNIGVKGVPQQASACFILAVDDTMDGILNWYREEGVIFKGGSGSGINLSNIRSSYELLNGGGTASGPVSFMRGADASAGTIKSGGKTRRAAKMVILNVDHPDIEEFVWCKAKEERKARVLRDAGFDMDLDGSDSFSIQYQNANNSVRVSDEFMHAVIDDTDWNLRAVTDGSTVRTVPRPRPVAADRHGVVGVRRPGPAVRHDDQQVAHGARHRVASTAPTRAASTCTSTTRRATWPRSTCLHYLDEDGNFDVDAYMHTVEVIFTAQEILVGRADYPTPTIAETSRQFRQLGIGYANLGALLMALGLPYDSVEGRAWAAALTSLMTGHAYATSARTASRMGPFAGFADNERYMLNVLRMHRDASYQIAGADAVPADVMSASQQAWEVAVRDGEEHGVRNSQASVLAPTGTIGLMMDCDTTGIEPDLGLVKFKKLVGGGNMQIVNQTVPRALRKLGYTATQVDDIVAYIDREKTILGAPHLAAEHVPVFACSMGDNTIHYEGHVRMMGAMQPFLSGAISKTVNMPEEASVEDIEALHQLSWELGLKAVAIYRDNCKVGQPLSTGKKDGQGVDTPTSMASAQTVERIVERLVHQPIRQKLPRTRRARTFEFRVADCKGFATIGEYADGRPGEIFLTVSKQGSTLSGIMDAFAKSISYGLQYGVPHAGLRRGVHQHALRAGRHDRRSRHPLRLVDHGLPVPPPGARVLDLRRACRAGHLLHRRAAAAHAAGRGGECHRDAHRQRDRRRSEERSVGRRVLGAARSWAWRLTAPNNDITNPGGIVRPAGSAPKIRQSDAPMCMQCGVQMIRAGSLPRLPELRLHQRLQLTPQRSCQRWRRFGPPASIATPASIRFSTEPLAWQHFESEDHDVNYRRTPDRQGTRHARPHRDHQGPVHAACRARARHVRAERAHLCGRGDLLDVHRQSGPADSRVRGIGQQPLGAGATALG